MRICVLLALTCIVGVFAGQPQLFDGYNWLNSVLATGTVKTKLLLPGAITDSGPAKIAIDAESGQILYDLGIDKFGLQYMNKTHAFVILPGVPLCLTVSGWNSLKQQSAYAANVTLKSIFGVKLGAGALLDYTYSGLVRDISSCEDYISTVIFTDRITQDIEQWEADQFIPLPRSGPLPPGLPGPIISSIDINLTVKTSGKPPASTWTNILPASCNSPYTTVDLCTLFKSGPFGSGNVAKRDVTLPNGLTTIDIIDKRVRDYYNI